MEVTKIDFQDVEALKHQLKARTIFPNRFNFDITEKEAANAIYAAMTSEVERRGKVLNLDDDTRKHILKAAQWLISKTAKPGLLLMGLYGNGKTTLLRSIIRLISFVTETQNGYSKRCNPRLITAKEIAMMCANEQSREEYRKLFNEPMLAIDDLGDEPAEVVSYGMAFSPITDLLSVRYEHQLITMATTNLNNPQIKEKYGARIADRFNEMLEVIIFRNQSYRK